MFVYRIARGVNEGWLDGSFRESAQHGWDALKAKVTLLMYSLPPMLAILIIILAGIASKGICTALDVFC
jgi:hypothetical protein